MRKLYSRIKRWCRDAWPWVALVALALAAMLGSRRAGQAIERRAKARDAERTAARVRAEEARRLAEALRDAQLAEADRERAQALKAGRAVADVEREHGARVAELLAMGAKELAAEAHRAAERSRRRRRGAGSLLVTLALLGSSVARAEPVCIEQEDVAQLVADSRELEAVVPQYRAQIAHFDAESAELRRSLQTSTLATQMAVRRAMAAEAEASADRMTAEKARRRAKWWGAGGVAVGALFTLLLAWGVK